MLWTTSFGDSSPVDYGSVTLESESVYDSLSTNKKGADAILRPMAKKEIARLKESDAPITHTGFYQQAENGYARNLPELTLHQVMRRLMRILEGELQKNISKLENPKDVTLLMPPAIKNGKKFYPAELSNVPEYKEYFYKKENSKPSVLSHQYQGNLRPVDDLDVALRGGDVNAVKSLYKENPNAGQSIHSKVGWKSILAKNDLLAISDPSIAKEQEKVKKMLDEQSRWGKGNH